MDKTLKPLTALGAAEPLRAPLGPWELIERVDVALASVAPRRGRDLAGTEVPVPDVAASVSGDPWSTFWLTPDMFMVEAPFASHEDIRAKLLAVYGDAASVTEQTDAWVRFDLKGADLPRLFSKLCNADLAAAPDGFATRTVIEHMGCYVIKRSDPQGLVTIYGARSMAGSLLHALQLAAGTVA